MVTQEKPREVLNGWIILPLLLAGAAVVGWGIFRAAIDENVPTFVFWLFGAVVVVFLICGFFTLQPNVGAVLTLFGSYVGSVRTPGFKWANPLYKKEKVSLRWHNLDGEVVKVNDSRGNPIEISAVVVWRVNDTARAVFDVEEYENFVKVQSEAALRHMAMSYSYDTFDSDSTLSLRGSPDEINAALQREVQERVNAAGVIIQEARLNHLAYAPEIAGAMLQRQQADAVVAARTRIVEGAVGMVEMALEKIELAKEIHLDEERKAAMVSNLLVVLCAHQPAQPIVNTGTLYT
jgi:regulator of protease activity HflC (stomatin/prohibitin superfamily)